MEALNRSISIIASVCFLFTVGCSNDSIGEEEASNENASTKPMSSEELVNDDKPRSDTDSGSVSGPKTFECGLDFSDEVTRSSVSDLSPETIVGDWTYIDEWDDRMGFIFNSDGTEGLPGELVDGASADWCLAGNVVTIDYLGPEVDSATENRQAEFWGTTAAIVDDRYYTNAFIRTQREGDATGVDGHWVFVEYETEAEFEGEQLLAEIIKGRIDISISGDTYTMEEIWTVEYDDGGLYPELEDEVYDTRCEGTVVVDQDTVVLTPTAENSGDCDETTLYRLTDDVMLFPSNSRLTGTDQNGPTPTITPGT